MPIPFKYVIRNTNDYGIIFLQKLILLVINYNIMDYKLNIEMVKIVYNWFHKAYPDYDENEDCTESEMLLSADLEQFLLDNS